MTDRVKVDIERSSALGEIGLALASKPGLQVRSASIRLNIVTEHCEVGQDVEVLVARRGGECLRKQ